MRQNKIHDFTWADQVWTNDFQKICGSKLDRIQFYRIMTGLGPKNFTVRSSLVVSQDFSASDAVCS